jgi:hypothetical protein
LTFFPFRFCQLHNIFCNGRMPHFQCDQIGRAFAIGRQYFGVGSNFWVLKSAHWLGDFFKINPDMAKISATSSQNNNTLSKNFCRKKFYIIYFTCMFVDILGDIRSLLSNF